MRIFILSLLVSWNAWGGSFESAYIETCHDGDTCKAYIARTSQWVTVRLAGLDAPELGQEYGDLALAELESRVKGREVQLECVGQSYRRQACRIYVEGVDIGGEMVRSGWAFEIVFHSGGLYREAQSLAQNEERGLWGLQFRQSPLCFREKKRSQCLSNPHFGITK